MNNYPNELGQIIYNTFVYYEMHVGYTSKQQYLVVNE
jgi:hypothetical protein